MRRRTFLGPALSALLLAGPGAAAAGPVVVHSLAVHGPLLLATLRGEGVEVQRLFPRSETCAQILRPEAAVEFSRSGAYGAVRAEAGDCAASGVASLEAWRDDRPRPKGPPLPRAPARYEVVSRDDQVIVLRGRFPMATQVDFGGAHDLLALVPNRPACAAAADAGESFMTFRHTGSPAFQLGSGDDACPVAGLAVP